MGVITVKELEAGLKPIRPIREYVWKKILNMEEDEKVIQVTIGADQLREMLMEIFRCESI